MKKYKVFDNKGSVVAEATFSKGVTFTSTDEGFNRFIKPFKESEELTVFEGDSNRSTTLDNITFTELDNYICMCGYYLEGGVLDVR